MFVKLYLGPTCAALNRPHGVAHCSQHVWPAVPFQNVIYLKIQFSLHKVYEFYHFVFFILKSLYYRAECTTMIFLGIQF